MKRDNIVVGLEVGTSKVCAVVSELRADGTINIIGIGQCPSRGVRKGEIVDFDNAIACIRQAIADAEESAGVEIRSVYAGVTGGHIRAFNNRGMVPITHEDREIGEEDVEAVMQNARAIDIPVENAVVHSMRQHFHVDGHEGVIHPIGMLGARLEADVLVIHGVRNRLQNSIRCIKAVPIEVDDVVICGVASALAVLNREQKDMGAVVIDIGGGTTDYAVYTDGVIKHIGILAVGGDHVTNDIHLGLKIPLTRADKLKCVQGSCMVDDMARGQAVTLPREIGMPERTVSKESLQKIIHLRMKETFEVIARNLDRHQLTDFLGAGVFVTGGGSHLADCGKLAEEVFGLPVHIKPSASVAGLTQALDKPELSTAIGLTIYGLASHRVVAQSPIKQGLGHLRQNLKELFARARLFLW
ncbi:MAG: cell division protein FtsA [Verrucomicrobiae bacterium]|nr:cell division protein FtsA [Verrucomicrobiae bacterium]